MSYEPWEVSSHEDALRLVNHKELAEQREKELRKWRYNHRIDWPDGFDLRIWRAAIPKGYTSNMVIRRLIALFAAKELGIDPFEVLMHQRGPGWSKHPDLGLDLARFCTCPNCPGTHFDPPERIVRTVEEILED